MKRMTKEKAYKVALEWRTKSLKKIFDEYFKDCDNFVSVDPNKLGIDGKKACEGNTEEYQKLANYLRERFGLKQGDFILFIEHGKYEANNILVGIKKRLSLGFNH
ncbi:MAG: hypothetical protein JSV12_03450 [Candidatus Bathyarchaeota archaeon]|nr:MAG: hypothetical protein JSV12_03450 [Candidatus Bathyarchaeota archaeon]